MTFKHASKLHNGDEVLLKGTGESINVLSIAVWNKHDGGRKNGHPPCVRIEGVGKQSGYGWWSNDQVR